MIGVFLLPFPVRGVRAPYLWVYYRLLHRFSEPFLLLAGKDYLNEPQSWTDAGRWEMQPISGQRLGYTIPPGEKMRAHPFAPLAESVFDAILTECGGSPVAAFRNMLTRRLPLLETALDEALSEHGPNLEAILTWCNCPSLSAVAERHGIPVVHIELGPLRWPDYRDTGYLDLRGVNGNTEAADRCARACVGTVPFSMAQLRRYFALNEPAVITPDVDLGLALQVEDDSNLIAFGNGFDNQGLINFSQLHYPRAKRMIRSHPGSAFAVKPGAAEVDVSPNSIAFIQRCRQVLTINSSVGIEAMLLDVPVTVLGDCSYRHLVDAPVDERVSRMAHYLFSYLVPLDLLFQPEYLRFRLALPSETAIVQRHLSAWGYGERLPAGNDGWAMMTKVVCGHS